MSETQTFLDRAMAGTALMSEIDDFIDQWHEGDSTNELHDYLGMTADEYSLWLQNPDMLAVICMARRRHQLSPTRSTTISKKGEQSRGLGRARY